MTNARPLCRWAVRLPICAFLWTASILGVDPGPLAAEPDTAAPSTAPQGIGKAADPLGAVAGSVAADLESSRRELAALRESIAAEKVPLTRELGTLEEKLAGLRRQQDETTRSQDGLALELGNLKEAMRLRQEETTYISNLLEEYARGFDATLHVSETAKYQEVLDAARLAPLNKDLSLTQRLETQVSLVRAALTRLGDVLGGSRYAGDAVDAQGSVASGQFAMIGPIVLFAGNGGLPAGLALAQTGSTRPAIRALAEPLTAGLAQVVTAGEGTLPLDPTRGGAIQDLVKRGNLIGYFKRGGPIMWPLLFVSILAVSVILERLIFLFRVHRARDHEVVAQILECVAGGDPEAAVAAGRDSEDYVARALTYALSHREKSLSNALVRAAGQELVRFNRGISILDTVITMAPLLGLLGTVTGMMGSFGMLGGAELAAPAQITGGIAEALIATAFGLGIAVTALIPLNFLHNKSEEARHEIEDASNHLELLMKPILDAETSARQARVHEALSRSRPREAIAAVADH